MPSLAEYLARVAAEHASAPRYRNFLEAVLQPFVDAQSFLAALPFAFDLDTAVGVQLDQVGEWIGRTRFVQLPLANTSFSWGIPGLGWGQAAWSVPFSSTDAYVQLDDDSYRLLLRSKIASNQWGGSMEELPAILRIMFPAGTGTHVFAIDNQDMSMDYGVSGVYPSAVQLAMLSEGLLAVKPEAVRVNYKLTSIPRTPIFGWGIDDEYIGGWGHGAWAIDPIDWLSSYTIGILTGWDTDWIIGWDGDSLSGWDTEGYRPDAGGILIGWDAAWLTGIDGDYVTS